ncbi:MAG: DUF1285 domain-containing protein [Pseudomonadota bacterium]
MAGKSEIQASKQIPAGLEALITRAGGLDAVKPPVHKWNPPHGGVIDMRIAADGLWYYRGSSIGREALVRLFASVLRKDGDKYVLVTPVEKVGITVEDAPFVAVELQVVGDGENQRMVLRTNVGDVVTIGKQHPLRFEAERGTGGLKPYVLVRDRLEARLARPLLYELAEIGVIEKVSDAPYFGVWSTGEFYPMAPESEISEYLE